MVGTACLGVALLRSASAPAAPSAQARPALTTPASPPTPSPAPPSPTPRPRVPPVHLSIPAIGVSRDLLRLGLNADQTVQVPASRDAGSPGWFRLGVAPGQVGSAVILGHVDSLRGPAVFYELRFLKPGNRVDVRLENGAVAHFAVRSMATYPNDAFPARRVYTSHGYRALNLVTCGGDYDKARGGYQSNVVVYTRLVGRTPARSGDS